MRTRASKRLAVVTTTIATVALVASASAYAAAPAKLTVISKGSTSLTGKGATVGSPAVAAKERTGPKRRGANPLQTSPIASGPDVKAASAGPATSGGKKSKSNPEIVLSWEGLNHLQQRTAFGGNQFSGEPPDQGLCVGNGYVLETVNSALRVFSSSTGAALTPPVALNEFYGFPPAINRTTGQYGPFTFDISCHYDPDSGRWFHLAVDLNQDPNEGFFDGPNYLDLAVSNSGDPRGSWTVYRIPGMNDGTEGTPDHGCTVDDGGVTLGPGPCFADFPHIGVDKNGVYITTNEFDLFGDDFIGAQVYAISKSALTGGGLSVPVYLFNTADDPVRPGEPGFTVWPSLSAGTQFAGNTEHFVSSNAVFDDANADSDELILWTLDKTNTLSSASPAVALTKKILKVGRYTVPSNSVQKPGEIPYGELFAGATAPGTIDTGDSRVVDVRYANGKLWAVLGTGATVSGQNRTGVGWYVINPNATKVIKEGILALEGESLAYPTIGVTQSGRGVIGFSRVGESLFPSVGYASLDAKAGAGDVKMIREGQSPQDGFTEYGGRARWGDYGAAAVDGDHVYVAGEYIEQPTCTVADFIATGGTCFGYRSTLANWTTRVTKLKP